MVDTRDLKSLAFKQRAGSSPASGTKKNSSEAGAVFLFNFCGKTRTCPAVTNSFVRPLGLQTHKYCRTRLARPEFHYMNGTPFGYFISLPAHKIISKGLAERVPTHSSPRAPPFKSSSQLQNTTKPKLFALVLVFCAEKRT